MRKSVCVDLDGVLARFDSWKGIDHIGDPIPGAVEFMRTLKENFRVVVYTTRCKVFPDPEKFLGSYDLVRIVKVWLDSHAFPYDEVYEGQGKPFAVAYVDDRAAVCEPQKSPLAFVNALVRVHELAGEFKPTDVSGDLAEHEKR
jgi:hypothetical protein